MATRIPLSSTDRTFLDEARRAILATIAPAGRPRPVPICFVLDPARPVAYSPLDDKPKRVDDVRRLARIRDILARPQVSLLVDRWDEDWSHLAWLRCDGLADLLEPEAGDEHATAVAALRAKYPQYEGHDLEHRPIVRIAIEGATRWSADGS